MKQLFAGLSGIFLYMGLETEPVWFAGAVVCALASIDFIVNQERRS